MENLKRVLAMSRLLEYASNLIYGHEVKDINFEDEIGQEAKAINEKLKHSTKIDLFSPVIKLEEIRQYEHLISNSISNYTNRKLVTRDVGDEVSILLKSKKLDRNALKDMKIVLSTSQKDDLEKLKYIDEDLILTNTKNCQYLSVLEADELGSQYFTTSKVKIDDREMILVTDLHHETRKKDELNITSFLLFPFDQYQKFYSNPLQLFLKGLDKYGIDMKIKDEVSRYYLHVKIPTTTNTNNIEFLNFQNYNGKDNFKLSLSIKKTPVAFELSHVYAINSSKFNDDMESLFD